MKLVVERVELKWNACRGQKLGEIIDSDATRKRNAFYSLNSIQEQMENMYSY